MDKRLVLLYFPGGAKILLLNRCVVSKPLTINLDVKILGGNI